MPLVSVIMPAYNAEKYIKDSIESVISQTYRDWELIIVDDGSVDGTKNVAELYTAADNRIKYYRQKNGKQGKARNAGLSKSTGSLIAFIDADDLWLPNKLETQIKQIENVDLVFSNAYQFEHLPVDEQNTMQSYAGLLAGNDGIEKMLEINRIPILTVMVKKASLEKVNFFSETEGIQNAEDYHLWLKLLMNDSKMLGTSNILSAYRVHSAASTSGNKLASHNVIEAFYDLTQSFPKYKGLIKTFLKKRFKAYHYSADEWNKNIYRSLIIKNCTYLSKQFYISFFVALYNVFGLKITRKVITAVLNN